MSDEGRRAWLRRRIDTDARAYSGADPTVKPIRLAGKARAAVGDSDEVRRLLKCEDFGY